MHSRSHSFLNSSTNSPHNHIASTAVPTRAQPRGRHFHGVAPVLNVHRVPKAHGDQGGKSFRQRLRIKQFQRRWEEIKEDLPPQLTRSHISMISIGGVIGTGLFLGSADALYHGGPVGALLGYSIIGSVVYCLCVSIGEMIAFLPNVGGVVGLADLFVDPALGFSLGWAAWYNWSVTLPTEIAAATVVVGFWDKARHVSQLHLSAIFLLLAVVVNCFPSRVYGESEFWFSTVKVTIIVVIIVASIVIDLGAGPHGVIAFSNWRQPFAQSYYGIQNSLGRFLGFLSVLIQACFSFSGSEVPGIAAGEVIDATRNVPRALRRVWIRITLFYVGGIFCAGLLVKSNDPALTRSGGSDGTTFTSPFVIAFKQAGMSYMSHVINATVLISAWSAAASDIYISSRFLYFLSRCRHAPRVFSTLFKYPRTPSIIVSGESDAEEEDAAYLDDHELQYALGALPGDPFIGRSAVDVDERCPGCDGGLGAKNSDIRISVVPVSSDDVSNIEDGGGSETHQKPSRFVIPLYAVLGSAIFGLLSFMSASGGGAETAFGLLSAITSIASLQSWAGMMYTYIRWYKGTIYHEKQCISSLQETPNKPTSEEKRIYEHDLQVFTNINKIKAHRHWGQPYLAYYALTVCMIILITNGWTVFLHTGWRIANIPGEVLQNNPGTAKDADIRMTFLSSYVPIPFFLLMTFGYKIIHQTKMVKVEEMDFYREHFKEEVPDTRPAGRRERILGWLLVI